MALERASPMSLTSAVLVLMMLFSAVPVRAQFESDFLHGIAAGDPMHDAIVLWTRVTPRMTPTSLQVAWSVREVGGEGQVIASGIVVTTADVDWTVKVDVRSPQFRIGTRYEYSFSQGSGAWAKSSPRGFFTLPRARDVAALERKDDVYGRPGGLRYAIFSCSNWGWGFFNAYEEGARIAGTDGAGLDFWLHLGDYIYEYGDHYPDSREAIRHVGLYGIGTNATVGLGSESIRPQHEIVSLQDYRERHSLYRSDASLQRLSSRVPMIAVWDDHEIANDPWMHGAQNHQPSTEGSFDDRERAAIRAYHEWMPTRTGPYGSNTYVGYRIYRSFDFGGLATLLVLESRLLARTEQNDLKVDYVEALVAPVVARIIGSSAPPSEWATVLTESTDEEYKGMTIDAALRKLKSTTDAFRSRPEKELLGAEQMRWVRENTEASAGDGVTWQLFGQQTVMMDYLSGNITAAFDDLDGPEYSEWRSQFESLMDPSNAEGMTVRVSIEGGESVERRATPSDFAAARFHYAIGYYGINGNFDSWSGYLAERSRFYESIQSAANPVIYAGDSHNAWAGIHTTGATDADGEVIANEFSGTSVTSPVRD